MAVLDEVRPHYGRLKLYIDGEWVESKSGEVIPSMNPAKGEAIAEVPFATKEEVGEAVNAAEEAFPSWSELPVTTRARYIYRMLQALEKNFEEISRVITQNHGKVIDEARGEMRRLVENVETAAAIAYTLQKGEHLDQVASGIDETLVREPMGVFAILGPFNFPVMAPFWFIPYALVLGDTLVVKPSEITPVAMDWLMKTIEEVKLPPGVLNVVHGSKDVATQLITHPKVQGVTFVGSTAVGKQVYKLAGEYGKRSIVQAGAKNFIVVMPDADLDRVVPALITSFYGNTGQRCLAGANLVPIGEVYEPLLRKFLEASKKLKLGYGLDESVDMGPLVSKRALDRVTGYIEKGVEEGAKLVLDGRNPRVPDYPNGYFIAPTIFTDVTPDMTIAREEIFGPVASIIHASSLDEALEMINKSNYGNAASIFTSNGEYAREFRKRVTVGNIGINVGIAAPMAFFPFGGWKDSFFGVLHGQIDCVDFFTNKKIVISRW